MDYRTFWQVFVPVSSELPLLARYPTSNRNSLAIRVAPGVRFRLIVNSRRGPAGVEVVFDGKDAAVNRERLERMRTHGESLEDALAAELVWTTLGQQQHMSWWFDAPSVANPTDWPRIHAALHLGMEGFYWFVLPLLVAEGIVKHGAVPLRYPGGWVDLPDGDRAFRIQNILSVLETQLVDAYWSLDRFESSQRELELAFSHGTREWPFGMPPPGQWRAPFVHARSVIQSLNNIRLLLKVISKLGAPRKEVAVALSHFESIFPDLEGVRNSEQHLDERVQGMVRGEPLPNETALWLGNLSGIGYETTMANGKIGRVEISGRSLESARGCVQAAINAFEWTGRPRWQLLS